MKTPATRNLWLLAASVPLLILGGCSVELAHDSDPYYYHHDRYDGLYSRTWVEPVHSDAVIIRDHDHDRDHDRYHGYAHERW